MCINGMRELLFFKTESSQIDAAKRLSANFMTFVSVDLSLWKTKGIILFYTYLKKLTFF